MSTLKTLSLLWLISLPIFSLAQTSDTQAPTLVEFDFSPNFIDVTAGSADVGVTARIVDDLSGMNFSTTVRFFSPSRGQFHDGFIARSTGNELDGSYSGTVQIPQFVESGTWTVSFPFLQDAVGNRSNLDDTTLASLGFPTELEVLSNEDTTAPVLVSATISPTAVDVSAGPELVTVTLHITDDVSGFDPQRFRISLSSPSSGQTHSEFSNSFTNTSGDAFDGIWEANLEIPQYSASDSWELSVIFLDDEAANSVNVFNAADVVVTSEPEDIIGPVVVDFQFTPTVIDTSAGSAIVNVSLKMRDDLSGVDFQSDEYFHGVVFRSPSLGQLRFSGNGSLTLFGTLNDGEWQGQIFFPQFSEDGTWKAELNNLADLTHNFDFLNATALAAAGFSTDLVVVRPSLDSDGTVSVLGGTITDDSFQFGTTTITLPPNTVTEDTDVAIDVFPDPLAVESPEGFSGPGTFFVNFDLDPEPAFPFPAPGASVTLPLPNPLPVGTEIPLFFVNEVTGTLVPMLSVSGGGGQVIGLVNADAISATFNGLSHFSILVGLLPEEPGGDGAVISLAAANVLVNEADGSVALTVNRTGTTSSAVSVNYTTRNRTAIAGVDYTAVSGTLSFAPGQTTARITVPITNDGQLEPLPNETFRVILSSPVNAELGENTVATVAIEDASTPALLLFSPDSLAVSVDEAAGTVLLTVNRSGAGRAVNVDYVSSNGTATAGEDYTATSGRLSFAAGQTTASIVVPITNDELVEAPTETFTVSLRNPNGGARLGASSAQVSINDNDGALPPQLPARNTVNSDDSPTTAIIYGGVTTDSGNTFSDSVNVSDAIQIPVLIVPESAEVGLDAQIYVVATDGNSFIQVTPEGLVGFDGTVGGLIAFAEVVLEESNSIDMLASFDGAFTLTSAEVGNWRFFIGYSTGDGVVTFNDEAIPLEVTE